MIRKDQAFYSTDQQQPKVELPLLATLALCTQSRCDTHLMCALDLQLWIQPVIQCRLLQDDPNLVLAIRRQTLEHNQISSEGLSKKETDQNEDEGASAWRSDLVGVLELQAGDDLPLQLTVRGGLGQDGLAELWDVGLTGLPQHRVEPVVCRDKDSVWTADSSKPRPLLAPPTCILGDLSLGDHLLAFRVHQLTVLVLLQTLKDVLPLRLGAKTLARQRHVVRDNARMSR